MKQLVSNAIPTNADPLLSSILPCGWKAAWDVTSRTGQSIPKCWFATSSGFFVWSVTLLRLESFLPSLHRFMICAALVFKTALRVI